MWRDNQQTSRQRRNVLLRRAGAERGRPHGQGPEPLRLQGVVREPVSRGLYFDNTHYIEIQDAYFDNIGTDIVCSDI